VASVYVHFPYCLTKCPYCDFVSYKTDRHEIDHRGYADAVLAELALRVEQQGGLVIDSIFFGGGTPSLWQTDELGRVLSGIRESLNVRDEAEVTVECNPTSLDHAKANALAAVGVNRLSIGVQGLQPSELTFLGRLHSAEGGTDAVSQALRSHIPRVSADFIFGTPSGTLAQEVTDACTLQSLGLRHMSCYQLTIEAGTRFGELAQAGRLPQISDARVAETFLAISEALEARGLRHYEISNFAAPGEESVHNLGYWLGKPYLGLGCGAYGIALTRDKAERYRNLIRPEAYVEAARKRTSTSDLCDSHETLSPETLMNERIMLGLRLRDGFPLVRAAEELGVPALSESRKRALEFLTRRDRVRFEGGILSIPKPAWLYADDTAARLFD
jgi:putative oxygen-independent coproporphyrinogen III oxidase